MGVALAATCSEGTSPVSSCGLLTPASRNCFGVSTLMATAARCRFSGRRWAVTTTSSSRGGACVQAGPAIKTATATDSPCLIGSYFAPERDAPRRAS